MSAENFDEELMSDIQSSNNTQLANTAQGDLPIESMQREIEQMNAIAQKIVENVGEDRNRTEELYDFYKDLIDISNDKSEASRLGMARALELKMNGTNQMLEILKVKAKLVNPNKGSSININLGNFDQSKGGDTRDLIDLVDSMKKDINN